MIKTYQGKERHHGCSYSIVVQSKRARKQKFHPFAEKGVNSITPNRITLWRHHRNVWFANALVHVIEIIRPIILSNRTGPKCVHNLLSFLSVRINCALCVIISSNWDTIEISNTCRSTYYLIILLSCILWLYLLLVTQISSKQTHPTNMARWGSTPSTNVRKYLSIPNGLKSQASWPTRPYIYFTTKSRPTQWHSTPILEADNMATLEYWSDQPLIPSSPTIPLFIKAIKKTFASL